MKTPLGGYRSGGASDSGKAGGVISPPLAEYLNTLCSKPAFQFKFIDASNENRVVTSEEVSVHLRGAGGVKFVSSNAMFMPEHPRSCVAITRKTAMKQIRTVLLASAFAFAATAALAQSLEGTATMFFTRSGGMSNYSHNPLTKPAGSQAYAGNSLASAGDRFAQNEPATHHRRAVTVTPAQTGH
jgi:hypothetical protein